MTSVDVVYIAGAGRSGSTILDRVLGTLPGVLSCNELRPVWRSGLQGNLPCACGQAFHSCPFWGAVMAEAFPTPPDAARMTALEARFDQSRWFFRLRGDLSGGNVEPALAEYRLVLGDLYRALAKVAGAAVVVDSSKVPTRALVLAGVPGIRVHVIHIVRDVRAIVHAWRKQTFNPATNTWRRRYSPLRTIAFWLTRNSLAGRLEGLLPYVRLRYEDFAAMPRRTMDALTGRIEPLRGRAAPFSCEDEIILSPLHSISGNVQRFTAGPTRLRLDDEWRTSLPAGTRRLATALGWPLLRRYGYVGNGTSVEAKAG